MNRTLSVLHKFVIKKKALKDKIEDAKRNWREKK